jgi:hypothetical protein
VYLCISPNSFVFYAVRVVSNERKWAIRSESKNKPSKKPAWSRQQALQSIADPEHGGDMFLRNVSWLSNGRHAVISHKTEPFITAAVRTSKPEMEYVGTPRKTLAWDNDASSTLPGQCPKLLTTSQWNKYFPKLEGQNRHSPSLTGHYWQLLSPPTAFLELVANWGLVDVTLLFYIERTAKDVDGSSRGRPNLRHYTDRVGKVKRILSGYSVSQPRFKQGISRIHVRGVTAWGNLICG